MLFVNEVVFIESRLGITQSILSFLKRGPDLFIFFFYRSNDNGRLVPIYFQQQPNKPIYSSIYFNGGNGLTH